MRKAYIIYEDSKAWYLKFFKRGFKHCFIVAQCMYSADQFMVIDYRPWQIRTRIIDKADLTVLLMMSVNKGHTVQDTFIRDRKPQDSYALASINCVTTVKRVLGLKAPWVLTPFQLFNKLKET
jgi:hypothetical protein